MSLIREAFDEIIQENAILKEVNLIDKVFINREESIEALAKNLIQKIDGLTPDLAKKLARTGLSTGKFMLSQNIAPDDFVNRIGAEVENILQNQTTAEPKVATTEPQVKAKADYIPFSDKSLMAKGYYKKTGKLSPEAELAQFKTHGLHDFMTDEEKEKEMKKVLPPNIDELEPWEKLKYFVQKSKQRGESVED